MEDGSGVVKARTEGGPVQIGKRGKEFFEGGTNFLILTRRRCRRLSSSCNRASEKY